MWHSSHRRIASLTGGAVALVTLALCPVAPAPAAAPGGPQDGLLLHYDLADPQRPVDDLSSADRDGVLRGGAAYDAEQVGVALDGANDFVELPDDVMAGLSSISVSMDVMVDPEQHPGSWLWGLGNTGANGQGDGYLFTGGFDYRTSITTGNWSGERTVSKGSGLARGRWTTLTYTLGADDVATLYQDGVQVGRQSGVDVDPGAVGGGHTTENYLGRSAYVVDPYFRGTLRDFRIYDRALTADEVAQIAAADDARRLEIDAEQLSLGDTSAVTEDLDLPTVASGGSTITWTSSAPDVVAADGSVTRPAAGGANAHATLTATVSRSGASRVRTFEVTVLPAREDSARVDDAAAALAGLPTLTSGPLLGSVTLPVDGAGLAEYVDLPVDSRGVTIDWVSSDASVLSDEDTGTGADVVAPGFLARDDQRHELTLTATVRLGDAVQQVSFDVVVPPLAKPSAGDLEAYAFTYFTGDNIDGETIRLATSRGNNALQWQTLNDARPVLESTKGDRGLRDPFLLRSVEGDRFFMLATDLSVGRKGWGDATRHGSRHLEVWESTDLVNWGEQRHVRVAPDNYGMVWAPEAHWDETIGAYVVYWTSSIYTDGTRTTPDEGGNPTIVYATTRDFRTFSEPREWLRAAQVPGMLPQNGLIDSTMIKVGSTYHRFTKGSDASGCPSPDIFQQRSDRIRDSSSGWSVVSRCIGRGAGTPEVEGPSIFKANPGDVNGGGRYYLWVDNYGGIGYIPLFTTDLDQPTWQRPAAFSLPASPRHGGVLAITRKERDALLGAHDPDQLVTATTRVRVPVTQGATTASLPSSVEVVYADGHSGTEDVEWEPYDLTAATAGQIIDVAGKLTSGAATPARARIVVVPDALTPTISGTPRVGSPVVVDPGAGWSRVTYRWLRGTTPIPGATSARYVAAPADAGARLSVQVTAVDGAEQTRLATVPVGTVAKARSTLRVPTAVSARRGSRPVLRGSVTSGVLKPSGIVVVREGSRELARVRLVGGRFVASLPARLALGRHRLTVVYLGSRAFTADRATTILTVTRARISGRVQAGSN